MKVIYLAAVMERNPIRYINFGKMQIIGAFSSLEKAEEGLQLYCFDPYCYAVVEVCPIDRVDIRKEKTYVYEGVYGGGENLEELYVRLELNNSKQKEIDSMNIIVNTKVDLLD